ncbi:hypothetical protein CUJ83_08445 [Methanocella sp. CWC-04]|uniref:Transcriptional regulator TbsP-like C-terminal domain-containing protein n=1 Tax=Methanooceanicella nereidis TaxID=2052831 RepID=A0AAP2RCH3_9EURY|nr:DUF5821 family protein [Methanocella sp. CWC-04]MCD1295024.1 hypothetical protein [Methanocella sp. CWC-04]
MKTDLLLNNICKTMVGKLKDQTIHDYQTIVEQISHGKYTLFRKNTIDIITIVLIAAAKNQEQFYVLSYWAKTNNITSTSTLSRRKNLLNNMGIIEEEKLKTPMGRPKIQLKLNYKRFEEYYGRILENSYCH